MPFDPSVISLFFTFHTLLLLFFHYHHRCNNVVFIITSTCTFTAEVVAYQSNGKDKRQSTSCKSRLLYGMAAKQELALQNPSALLMIVPLNRPMVMKVYVSTYCSSHGRQGQ